MNFRWVVRKKIPHLIEIHDLGNPDENGGFKRYAFPVTKPGHEPLFNLHEHFTYEQLVASQGLKDALRAQWVVNEGDVVPPAANGVDPNELNALRQQMAQMSELMQNMLRAQSTPAVTITAPPVAPTAGVDSGLLNQILQKLDNIGGEKPTKPKGKTAAEAALIAFDKHGGEIESHFEISGEKKTVETNVAEQVGKLAQFDLSSYLDNDDD